MSVKSVKNLDLKFPKTLILVSINTGKKSRSLADDEKMAALDPILVS